MRRILESDVTNALDNSAHQSVNGEDDMKGAQLVKPAELMTRSNETNSSPKL